MKYRIKEENDGFGTIYYPQYKRFLFWHCFSRGLWNDKFFFTLKDAKDWLKREMIKKKIRILEI